MSNSWQQRFNVESNRVLELQRGNQATWDYRLPADVNSAYGYINLYNSYGQRIGSWEGLVSGGVITFDQSPDVSDSIPAGTSWQLFADVDGATRLLAQGTVVRSEAPYPDAPPQSSEYDGVRYQYQFATPGLLYDPAWRIMYGQPRIYDNSARSLPNAVTAGSIAGGDLVAYGKCAMLYYAPLKTDAVRLTYNTIRNNANSNGTLYTVICSNYDMTNWVGFRHSQVFGVSTWDNDSLQIVVGSGPTTYVTKATVAGDTANNTYYTAEYNPLTNKYTLWKGTTQVLQWTDSTKIVSHGVGQRYVGFGFQGAVLDSGVQVSDWLIADAP